MDNREFEFLLNRMEAASSAASPVLAGYNEKRKAVLSAVASLRARVEELEREQAVALAYFAAASALSGSMTHDSHADLTQERLAYHAAKSKFFKVFSALAGKEGNDVRPA